MDAETYRFCVRPLDEEHGQLGRSERTLPKREHALASGDGVPLPERFGLNEGKFHEKNTMYQHEIECRRSLRSIEHGELADANLARGSAVFILLMAFGSAETRRAFT